MEIKSIYELAKDDLITWLPLKNIFFNEFHYSHSEKLGDAFEYLLSFMGSQGDAGQFRTPRHIIDFIVEIVNPQKDETILDPACGTAGFLISSFKHILNQNTKNNYFKDKLLQTIQYFNNEFKNNEKLYGSAYDADSEGVEGKYYVWSYEELKNLLKEDIKLLENKYEISESGNFEGNNILVEKNLIPDEDKNNLDQIKNKLLNIRRKRVKPLFDDKSQTDLNAYMLQVLLKTSVYLDDEDLKNNTIETIEILNTKLHQKIIHCYENKEIETFLEDYVYYALLMITLYEVNADKKALEKSIKIMNDTWELFFNKETQLFQKNIIKDNDLFASPLDLNDSNIPNGNSVYLLISNKLYSITNDKIWSERNEVLKKSFHQVLNSYYSQMFSFIKTLDICDNSLSFTFSGTSQSIKEIQLYLQKEYLGVATFVYQLNNDTKPSVIVCKNQTCSNKLTNINEAVEYLSKSY